MLFEQQEEYVTVESTAVGVLQHDPFSWVVEGLGFLRKEGISGGAGFLDRSLNEWIASMSREERESFVDTLFSVLRQRRGHLREPSQQLADGGSRHACGGLQA